MAINSYKELTVWQKARLLVRDVYMLCEQLPKDEVYGLANQMKRASVSIPSNIAEGYRRNGRKEYVQFLGIALGSAAELETQLILVQDIFELEIEKEITQVEEVQKMLLAMRQKLYPRP
ncbi:MAG: four helix bundle protein [bacterium]|nr:four helix bundle protein [bacterium]